VESLFETLNYPVSRRDAAAAFDDVELQLADGRANLGALVGDLSSDSFSAPEELAEELNNALPREAVGEPGQSEGEG
jgi:hypothetical protein